MITFNNFQRSAGLPIVNLTLPFKSIVYLDGENVSGEILHAKPFCGEILYNEIPINFCKKSFLKKICCVINLGQMFEGKLTLIENLKIYAQICGAGLILNAPIKYFEIQEKLLNEKVRDLEQNVVQLAEIGTMFYFTHKICMVANVSKEIAENEKVKHLIVTKVNNGNDVVFYTGTQMAIESQIVLNV